MSHENESIERAAADAEPAVAREASRSVKAAGLSASSEEGIVAEAVAGHGRPSLSAADEAQSDVEFGDGDVLPDDLDITKVEAPIEFPNNDRRRVPAALYLLSGAAAVWAVLANPDSPFVNTGVAAAGVGLILFGVYGLVSGVRMRIDEREALASAAAGSGFAVGHASAQQVWRGWLSRPTWRVLLYSAENPPQHRRIALVDAVDGTVIEAFSEENPEAFADV